MRRSLLIFGSIMLIPTLVWAQPVPPGAPAVVITEIMYHAPNSGTDNLDFIELRNPSELNERSLNGVHFTDGIEFTFPDGILLPPHGFALVAKDSLAFENFFGITAFQWVSGSLPDLEGTIVLKSFVNQTVDSVSYDTNLLWPQQAAGNGASIVLCNDTLENAGPTNWTAAATSTGLQVDGIPIFANPNADCSETNSVLNQEKDELSIYPNPCDGHFSLRLPASFQTQAVHLTIMDPNGRTVFSSSLSSYGSDQEQLSIGLANGMYVLTVSDGPDAVRQRLVVVR
jgi:hypothetical protein